SPPPRPRRLPHRPGRGARRRRKCNRSRRRSSRSSISRPRRRPKCRTRHKPRPLPRSRAAWRGGGKGGGGGGGGGGGVGAGVGGQLGGVVGGTLGGQLGGQLGGTGTALRVGGDVKAPVAINRIDPQYTELARRARASGFVIVEAIIDQDGNVTDAHIVATLVKPAPFGLDQAALEAVRRWRFKPGTLNGQPVSVIYDLTVNFRLQ